MIAWYSGIAEFAHAAARVRPSAQKIEDALSTRSVLSGYCVVCADVVDFRLDVDVWMGQYRNYREGVLCPRCGGNSRSRLVADAVFDIAEGYPRPPSLCLLEAVSPLCQALRGRFGDIACSEFFGSEHEGGSLHQHRGVQVSHQDVTALTYGAGSFDIFCHNDVLEHVYDYRRALGEVARVLRPGGWMVASVPFFYELMRSVQRGRIEPDGTLTHLLPAEYHGDGLRDGGIYTYYHFGLDLLLDIAAAGFDRVEVGITHDPFRGYLSNNYRYGGHGYMLPTLIRARRAIEEREA